MLLIFGVSLFVLALAGLMGAWLIFCAETHRNYRGPRTLICPETRRAVTVEIDARHAALTALGSHPHLRLTTCTRWPEREDCDQDCVPQVALQGDDRRVVPYAPGGLSPRYLRQR